MLKIVWLKLASILLQSFDHSVYVQYMDVGVALLPQFLYLDDRIKILLHGTVQRQETWRD